jgi:hypothetical protein
MHRLLVALLLGSGCAFGIKAPDPDRPRSQPPVCDSSKGAVALDGLMAGVAGLITIALVEDSPGGALIPAGIGALYLGGALKGNSNANKCREARAEYESYVAARETLDVPRRPPPVEDVAVSEIAARPVVAPVVAPAAPAAPHTAAVVAPPTPAVSMPVAPAPAPTAPVRAPTKPQPPPKAEPEDDWSTFWREVE